MKTSSALLSACPAASEITTPNGDYAAGNYFEITSENYLGTKQHYQFQPSDVVGTIEENGQQVIYRWSSKCDAIGDCNSETTKYNSLTEIPRLYLGNSNGSVGGHFNWYAATAESGTFSMLERAVDDSICPQGWQMSRYGNDADKSLFNMAVQAYGLSERNASSGHIIESVPLAFATRSGTYDGSTINSTGYGWYWTNRSYNSQNSGAGSARIFRVDAGGVHPSTGMGKTAGGSIRCVLK